jgi:hypothetical protein
MDIFLESATAVCEVIVESGLKKLQSFISSSTLLLDLVEFTASKHFPTFNCFNESLGHLYDRFRVVGGQGEEVFCGARRERLEHGGIPNKSGD